MVIRRLGDVSRAQPACRHQGIETGGDELGKLRSHIACVIVAKDGDAPGGRVFQPQCTAVE